MVTPNYWSKEHSGRTNTNHNYPTPTTTDNVRNKLFAPYVKGISEKIEHVCTPLGVKAAFKSTNTLRQSLMQVKNPRPNKTKRGVVYQVPCGESNQVYVGETGQCLQKKSERTQVCCEDKWYEERNHGTCLEQPTQSGLGVCQGNIQYWKVET